MGNTWKNRLAGDSLVSESARVTRMFYPVAFEKNTPLEPSGLIGPVTLQVLGGAVHK